MAQLTLSFLGPPSVERDGQPLEVDTRKAIALLAYLATTGQTQTRDALSTLLWPEYDQANARANLRRTLSALKRGLADQWLSVDREHIGLQQTPEVWIDLDHFRRQLADCQTHGHATSEVCAACVEPLSRAAALCRGDFLAGFTLRESAAFDDWQAFQAESFARDLGVALERLTRGLSAARTFEPAISFGRRWLALDPLHEPAHRRLMLLYAWAGERASAMRQYRECVRVLDEELGVGPLAETTELAEAIKSNHQPDPPEALPTLGLRPPEPEPPVQPAPMALQAAAAEQLPMVGRSAEWGRLVSVITRPNAEMSLVTIEGEAGIGKTRLAEEFLAYVGARGGHAIAARCYQDEAQLAYAPIVEGLRGALAHEDAVARLSAVPSYALAEAARLVPELASVSGVPIATPPDGPAAHGRFVDSLAQVVLALGGSSPPGVLLVDDAHLADEGTLDLLTYLVRRVRGRRFCVVVTWRSEDVVADHRLRRLLAETRRVASPISLLLGRLAQGDVDALVRAAATGGYRAPADAVFKETEGLPFFIVEYLRASIDGDRPEQLLGGVRELLQSRLLGVSQTAMQLLTTAAVIGRLFDFDTLRQASGRSEDEAVSALDELLGRGLVREVPGGVESRLTFDFSHVRLRDLVYNQTTLSRRRLLHRRVADALESRRSTTAGREPGALAGQIALHYQRAGHEAQAAECFRLAGEHARGLYANAEALSHFKAALALGHPAAASLHEAIGDLLTLAGKYRAAVASYDLAAALCSGDQLPRVEHKLGQLYCRSGEWDRAESHFQSAEVELGPGGHEAERARLSADRSMAAQRRGETERASELAARAQELAEAADDAQALLQAHNVLGILAASQANLGAAQEHLERSLALTEVLNDRAGRIAVLNNLSRTYAAHGQRARALQAASTALDLCVAQGDRHHEAALHNNLADLLYADGRSEEAMVHLKQAVTIFAEVGSAADPTQPEIWKLTEW